MKSIHSYFYALPLKIKSIKDHAVHLAHTVSSLLT